MFVCAYTYTLRVIYIGVNKVHIMIFIFYINYIFIMSMLFILLKLKRIYYT